MPSTLGNLSLIFMPSALKLTASESAVLRAESGVPLSYENLTFLHAGGHQVPTAHTGKGDAAIQKEGSC